MSRKHGRLQPVSAKLEQRLRAADGSHLTRETVSPYLTSREVISYLRLGSLRALYRHIKENNLPFRRVGRDYRFHRLDIDAWTMPGGQMESRKRA